MYNSWGINATGQCQQMARSCADQNQKPHWTPFRDFPRLFRKFPHLFREFPLLFLARLCSKNGIHPSTRLQSHATGCSRPFNHPTNSRWVQATMPHYKILWWDASWSSDTCGKSGANDSFPLSPIFQLILESSPLFVILVDKLLPLAISVWSPSWISLFCCRFGRASGEHTSSTAQGGGGSFKNRKPIGEIGCCESGMAERIHWWTERCLRSPLFLSLSLTIYPPTNLSSMYLSIYRSIYLSLSLSISLSFI